MKLLIQALAIQGIEAAQAAVLHRQLQVFPSTILCRLSLPFVTIHFCQFLLLFLLLCTLASCYFAASPGCFCCFSSFVFRFALLVDAYLLFACFPSVSASFCILFSLLVIFTCMYCARLCDTACNVR